jgi:hypothetical protein
VPRRRPGSPQARALGGRGAWVVRGAQQTNWARGTAAAGRRGVAPGGAARRAAAAPGGGGGRRRPVQLGPAPARAGGHRGRRPRRGRAAGGGGTCGVGWHTRRGRGRGPGPRAGRVRPRRRRPGWRAAPRARRRGRPGGAAEGVGGPASGHVGALDHDRAVSLRRGGDLRVGFRGHTAGGVCRRAGAAGRAAPQGIAWRRQAATHHPKPPETPRNAPPTCALLSRLSRQWRSDLHGYQQGP